MARVGHHYAQPARATCIAQGRILRVCTTTLGLLNKAVLQRQAGIGASQVTKPLGIHNILDEKLWEGQGCNYDTSILLRFSRGDELHAFVALLPRPGGLTLLERVVLAPGTHPRSSTSPFSSSRI